MASFYVNLPSNVISNRTKNKIGSYTTFLPTPLILDDSWKVALSEIHFTNSWFNITTYNEISIVATSDPTSRLSYYAALEPGRYSDIGSLVSTINMIAKDLQFKKATVERLPELSFNRFSRRINMKHGCTTEKKKLQFGFSKELSELLGVDDGYTSRAVAVMEHIPVYIVDHVTLVMPTIEETEEVFESNRCYDLNAGINSLYVYSDVVDYTVVGDVKAQLLRVVKIPSNSTFGEGVDIRFEKPYYIPVGRRDIRSIEIEIKDDTNSLINFQFGRVEVTLHFQKDEQYGGLLH